MEGEPTQRGVRFPESCAQLGAGSINPYHEWLGLGEDVHQPNSYELLQIPKYEKDPQVVIAAADRALSQVRSCRPGQHAKLWAALLDQIQEVKQCLTDPSQKAAYDRKLQAGQGVLHLGATPAPADDIPVLQPASPHSQPANAPVQPVNGPEGLPAAVNPMDPMAPINPAAAPSPGFDPPAPAGPNPSNAAPAPVAPGPDPMAPVPANVSPAAPTPMAPQAPVMGQTPVAPTKPAPASSHPGALNLAGPQAAPAAPQATGPVVDTERKTSKKRIAARRAQKSSVVVPALVGTAVGLVALIGVVYFLGGLGGAGSPTPQKTTPTAVAEVTQPETGTPTPVDPIEPPVADPTSQSLPKTRPSRTGSPRDEPVSDPPMSTEPEPEPEPTPEPVVEPLTAEERSQLAGHLKKAREALSTQEFQVAADSLTAARQLARMPEHKALVERLARLATLVQQFHEALAKSLGTLKAGEELVISDSHTVVVSDVNQERIILEVMGTKAAPYPIKDMAPGLAMALAVRAIGPEKPEAVVVKGAYFAVHPRYKESGLERVRRWWNDVALVDESIKDLIPVLDDDYSQL